MNLGDFSSLFELSAGIILASSVGQALFEHRSIQVSKLVTDILNLKDTLSLSMEQHGRVDPRLQEIQIDYYQHSKTTKLATEAFAAGNFAGALIPIACLYYGPQSGDIGMGMINVLIFLSLAWGPLWILLAWRYVDFHMKPVREAAELLRDDIVLNRI